MKWQDYNISNSSSLRLERLCVRQIHISTPQCPNFYPLDMARLAMPTLLDIMNHPR